MGLSVKGLQGEGCEKHRMSESRLYSRLFGSPGNQRGTSWCDVERRACVPTQKRGNEMK